MISTLYDALAIVLNSRERLVHRGDIVEQAGHRLHVGEIYLKEINPIPCHSTELLAYLLEDFLCLIIECKHASFPSVLLFVLVVVSRCRCLLICG